MCLSLAEINILALLGLKYRCDHVRLSNIQIIFDCRFPAIPGTENPIMANFKIGSNLPEDDEDDEVGTKERRQSLRKKRHYKKDSR